MIFWFHFFFEKVVVSFFRSNLSKIVIYKDSFFLNLKLNKKYSSYNIIYVYSLHYLQSIWHFYKCIFKLKFKNDKWC